MDAKGDGIGDFHGLVRRLDGFARAWRHSELPHAFPAFGRRDKSQVDKWSDDELEADDRQPALRTVEIIQAIKSEMQQRGRGN